MSEKKKTSSTVIDRFGGVDHTKAYVDIFSAEKIENFRILNDGSLEKRCGCKFLHHLGYSIRTVYSCCINGVPILFALISNTVYTYITAKDKPLSQIGTVSTTSGNACFFYYRETLYLLDGKNIYEYSDGVIKAVEGYVPLVAKNWPTTVPGEINEPRNILTRHARATYMVDRESIYLCVQDEVESVEALYVNGMLMPSETYSIDNKFKTVNVQGLTVGDRVEIYFTYKNGYDELFERLCSSTSSALFGGIGRNRIFLCGNNGTGTVFSSKSVGPDSITQSRKHYPESGSLYFPSGYEFEARDGISEVKAITRLYDRLVIFTENDVWIVDPNDVNSDLATTSSANANIGCPVANGATLSENIPISIGRHSVFAWDPASENKLNAKNISLPVSDELNEEFLSGCGIYYDVTRNELWIYNQSFPKVWIYNTLLKVWYSFTNISPEMVFDFGGSVAFIKNGSIYVFDESIHVDYSSASSLTIITGLYTSNYSELGEMGKKNLRSVTVKAEFLEGSVLFSFDTPEHQKTTYTINHPNGEKYVKKTFRYPVTRYERASFTITATGWGQQKIHSLTLTQR